jgi:hypothetical protein
LRTADLKSVWAWINWKPTVRELNVAGGALTLAVAVVILAVSWRRMPAAAPGACAAVIAASIALAKVASPQYALWLLPFFAVVRVRLRWWLLFVASEGLLFASLFVQWFTLVAAWSSVPRDGHSLSPHTAADPARVAA